MLELDGHRRSGAALHMFISTHFTRTIFFKCNERKHCLGAGAVQGGGVGKRGTNLGAKCGYVCSVNKTKKCVIGALVDDHDRNGYPVVEIHYSSARLF